MKKKLLICFVVIVSLCTVIGCSNKKEETKNDKKVKQNVETNKDVYIKHVKELKKVSESTEELPFTVEVKYEKMDDEVRYQVIIDNPTTNITDIKAIAIHNKQTDNVFPSVGIFDKKVDLIPDKKPSGVILVGYFPYEGDIDNLDVEMKVLISYKLEDKTYTSYYVTKK